MNDIKLIALSLYVFSPFAWSGEILVLPNLFLSTKNFDYSVYNGGVSGTIQSLGGGLTIVAHPFYFDIVGERNITTPSEPTKNLLETNQVEFDRTDLTTTLGYAVNDFVSVFGGYKHGKSTITALTPSPFKGAKISLEGKGVFMGAGGRWAVKDWGFLSFSAAYAYMMAIYKDLTYQTVEGNASGTSLGIHWKSSLTKHFYYDLSIIHHNYYYEDFDKFEWDISEKILSYRIGMSYRFF